MAIEITEKMKSCNKISFFYCHEIETKNNNRRMSVRLILLPVNGSECVLKIETERRFIEKKKNAY